VSSTAHIAFERGLRRWRLVSTHSQAVARTAATLSRMFKIHPQSRTGYRLAQSLVAHPERIDIVNACRSVELALHRLLRGLQRVKKGKAKEIYLPPAKRIRKRTKAKVDEPQPGRPLRTQSGSLNVDVESRMRELNYSRRLVNRFDIIDPLASQPHWGDVDPKKNILLDPKVVAKTWVPDAPVYDFLFESFNADKVTPLSISRQKGGYQVQPDSTMLLIEDDPGYGPNTANPTVSHLPTWEPEVHDSGFALEDDFM